MKKLKLIFLLTFVSNMAVLYSQSLTLMKDINPGSADCSYSGNGGITNNKAFFVAKSDATGGELAVSDGTPAGTKIVKDIRPGTASSDPEAFFGIGNTMYFIADDGINGEELWKSDGTEAGTVMVKNIGAGAANCGIETPFNSSETFVELGGKLYFAAAGGLWVSDGTDAGTKVAVSKNNVYSLKTFNNKIYFIAEAAGGFGRSIYSSDGTTVGTTAVVALNGTPANLRVVPGTGVFFNINNFLFMIKPDNTFLQVKKFTYSNSLEQIATYSTGVYKGKYYFIAVDNTDGFQVWSSDGTSAGTTMLKKIAGNFSSETFGYFQEAGDYLYFMYNIEETFPRDLWRTDGTSAGTIYLTSFAKGGFNFIKKGDIPVRWKNKLYWLEESANDISHLRESDGTVAGTKKTLLINDSGSVFYQFTTGILPINNGLIFSADAKQNTNIGEEMWKYTYPAPALTAVTLTQTTTIKCFGDKSANFTAVPTGGTAPFTYQWNTTISGLSNIPAGAYTVTITDDFGLTLTKAVTVTEPAEIKITPSFTANSATANVTGGTGTLAYKWSTTPVQTTATASNLAAGTYTVTVTDANGCSKTATTSLALPLSATIELTTAVKCFGDKNATLTAKPIGGSNQYTYLWSNAVTTAENKNLGKGTYSVTVSDGTTTKTATLDVTEPTKLSTTTNTTKTAYFSKTGSATALVTGGTLPYSYVWDSNPVQTTATAGGLGLGKYNVTVTDKNGCTFTATADVKEFLKATLLGTGTSLKCFGDKTAELNCSGAGGETGKYTYLWSNGITTAANKNLGAGKYTVTVYDGAESDAISMTVTEPSQVKGAITTVDADATNKNGSATVVATGGYSPYTYAWNTTPIQTTAKASNLSGGAYAVSITDVDGCVGTANAIVKGPLAVTIAQVGKIKCNGEKTVSLTADVIGGTAPYTYKWSNGVVNPTNLGAGTYTVTVTDTGGKTITASSTVTEPTILTVTTTSVAGTPANKAGKAKATPAGGTSPYTYLWNTVPAQTTQEATNLAPGSYTVTVTDANGCKTNTTVVVKNNVGTNDLAESLGLTVFPNPTSNIINIDFKEISSLTEEMTYQINDMTGKNVLNGQLQNKQIDVAELPQGMYLLVLKDKKNNAAVVSISIIK